MSALAKSLTSTDPTDWPAEAIPKHWIENLFEKMSFTYGAKFADQWKDIDPSGLKRHWAKELGKLTNEQLKTGVAKLDTRDWPPTLPEFVKLCNPAVDPTVAYYEAVAGCQARDKGDTGVWSHPAVYWASVKVTAFDLLNQTYSQIKPRWEKALSDELAKGNWADIPAAMLALPEPGKSDLSREKAAQMISELQAEGVVKTVATKTNHRAWIGKIFDRVKKKDSTLPGISITFAKQAEKAREA